MAMGRRKQQQEQMFLPPAGGTVFARLSQSSSTKRNSMKRARRSVHSDEPGTYVNYALAANAIR